MDQDIEIEHWQRYLFSLDLVTGKNVHDIASGEGYGSALMTSVAEGVVGIDIDKVRSLAGVQLTRRRICVICMDLAITQPHRPRSHPHLPCRRLSSHRALSLSRPGGEHTRVLHR